ncbi:MAG: hypothetical protein U9Q89_02705 [Thermodesulfobacteriota bacterium]|nr:hypothetical protein [Thermodesulfobacteriota bacterium]
MEQVLEVKALEPAEAWDRLEADAVDPAALPQAPEETAFALIAVNDSHIKLQPLALSENAPSAGPP